jgi:phosphoglycolate phosphatase-like HAD superfamily hydrolase
MSNLFLFDLDKTLIDVLPLQVAAFRKVWKEVYNKDADLKMVEFRGVRYLKIVKDLITLTESRTPEENEVEEVVEKLKNAISTFIQEEGVVELKGAYEFLKNLKENDTLFGLVTGNTTRIGNTIIENTRFSEFFPKEVRFYGDHWNKRSEGILTAIDKCKKFYEKEFEKIFYIGDSHNDVSGAKEAKVISVAVATGDNTYENLKKLNPDFCFRDLTEAKVELFK